MYHHSLANLSKCHQFFLSKQSIFFLAFYVLHGATSILDGLVKIKDKRLQKNETWIKSTLSSFAKVINEREYDQLILLFIPMSNRNEHRLV